MSFSYHNRLPYYAWGYEAATNSITSTMPTSYFEEYVTSAVAPDYVRTKVPIIENGGIPSSIQLNQYWDSPASLQWRPGYETSPCDRQVPWKKITTNSRGLSTSGGNGMGLTLFGELYATHAIGRRFFVTNTARRITKIPSLHTTVPFKWLSDTVVTGSAFNDCYAVVNRDGNPFLATHISKRVYIGSEEEYIVPVLPIAGESISKMWVCDGGYVSMPNTLAATARRIFTLIATTQSGKTYARAIYGGASNFGTIWQIGLSYADDWVLITGGVTNVTVSRPPAEFRSSSQPPEILVDPPPSGGVRARLLGGWEKNLYDRWVLRSVYILNPGSGYSSPPSAGFSDTPIVGTAQTIQAEVFTDTPRDFIGSRQAAGYNQGTTPAMFVTENNRLFSFVVPPTSLPPSGEVMAGSTSESSRRIGASSDYATVRRVFNGDVICRGWAERRYDVDGTQDYRTVTSSGVKDSAASGLPYAVFGANASAFCFIGGDDRLYVLGPSGYSVFGTGRWSRVASVFGTLAAISLDDGGLYTWGAAPGLYGDGTTTVRDYPVRVAPGTEWIDVIPVGRNAPVFIAIRKDAVCRSIDQPMEYWPDSYFSR